jgi:hypothetical protein
MRETRASRKGDEITIRRNVMEENGNPYHRLIRDTITPVWPAIQSGIIRPGNPAVPDFPVDR